MSIKDYNSTASNNTAISGIGIQGTNAVSNFDGAFRQLMADVANWTDTDTIASAGTTDLSTVDGTYITVSGTTTITAFGTLKSGMFKFLKFDGALTLTHNATSLILPRAENITTVAGDTAAFVSLGSGNWRCLFVQRTTAASARTDIGITEGTWTPAITFATPGNLTVVYSNQQGRYIKVGKQVTVSCIVNTTTFTHTTASGELRVTGLPFASVTSSGFQWTAATEFGGITLGGGHTIINANLTDNVSHIRFVASGSGIARAVLNTGSAPSGTQQTYVFNLTYEAAS